MQKGWQNYLWMDEIRSAGLWRPVLAVTEVILGCQHRATECAVIRKDSPRCVRATVCDLLTSRHGPWSNVLVTKWPEMIHWTGSGIYSVWNLLWVKRPLQIHMKVSCRWKYGYMSSYLSSLKVILSSAIEWHICAHTHTHTHTHTHAVKQIHAHTGKELNHVVDYDSNIMQNNIRIITAQYDVFNMTSYWLVSVTSSRYSHS